MGINWRPYSVSPLAPLGTFSFAPNPAGDFQAITTATVDSSGSGNITFNSIPSIYKHLQIRGIGRTTATGVKQLCIQLNSDTTANYSDHTLRGEGSSVTSAGDTSVNYMYFERLPSASETSGVFAAFIIDLLDYTSTAKNKTLKTLGGFDANGSGRLGLGSGLWYKTPESVTSITLTVDGGGNFSQYTQFALYGIKG